MTFSNVGLAYFGYFMCPCNIKKSNDDNFKTTTDIGL